MRSLYLAVSFSVLLATGGCATAPVSAQSTAGGPPPAQTAKPAATAPPAAVDLKLPNKKGTVKFAVIGDNGTGEKEQYEIGAEMAKWQTALPFDFVIMLGDNMYGSQNPRDFVKKFEEPYKALLERDVKFYAALGNHDNQENRFYKPWNMNGERFYTLQEGPRPLLRARHRLPRSAAAPVDRAPAAGVDRRLEDRLLPPSALLLGGGAWIADRPAADPRAALREVRRERRLPGTRSRLRADQAAEGDLLLRRGIVRKAAPGRPAEDRR